METAVRTIIHRESQEMQPSAQTRTLGSALCLLHWQEAMAEDDRLVVHWVLCTRDLPSHNSPAG